MMEECISLHQRTAELSGRRVSFGAEFRAEESQQTSH
jgi:hypothetical protein